MKPKIQLFLLGLLAILFSNCTAKDYSVNSPGNTNTIQFKLDDGKPVYAVKHGTTDVILPSEMGFVFKNNDTFNSNFEVTETKTDSFDETWEQVWGEKRYIRNNYNQLTVTLTEKTPRKRKLIIEFRAFDDGVAFRYTYPKQNDNDSIFIMDEKTEFKLADAADAWSFPAYQENRYEYLFTKSPVSELKNDTVHTPLTLESKSKLYLSIHEARLVDFASMTLAHTGGNNLKCDLVPWADGVKVRVKDSFQSSWRTIQIGQTPGDLITSYLILNLNDPNKLEDTSWIKPTKYMGIWWGMHIGKYTFWESEKQGATTENARKYIDFASEKGIDHLLIEGWNKGWTPSWYQNAMHMFSFTQCADRFNLEEVAKYAQSKGVHLIGYHETGSNLINYLKQIDDGMALYEKLGIQDVKIGHVGSRLNMKQWHHGQYAVNYYRYVLKKALEHHLTVNYHEPIKDTGERRTYPNMLSREGARGQEYDAWSDGNPPSHMCTLPFTRLLAGPMDFTPGIFDLETKQGYGRKVHSTLAKQLSYYVTIYSPIQMLADLPENYKDHPAFTFLQEVPTDWEDTKVLNGEIGEYVTIARKDRHSDDWFLGSMTNEKNRSFSFDLSFLTKGVDYMAEVYSDASGTTWENNPMGVAISKLKVNSETKFPAELGAGGGMAIHFRKM